MHMGFCNNAEICEQAAFIVNTAARTGATAEAFELQCHISKSDEIGTFLQELIVIMLKKNCRHSMLHYVRLWWIQIQSQNSDLWKFTRHLLHQSHVMLFVCLIRFNGFSIREVKPCNGVWQTDQLSKVIQVPPADPSLSCSQKLIQKWLLLRE